MANILAANARSSNDENHSDGKIAADAEGGAQQEEVMRASLPQPSSASGWSHSGQVSRGWPPQHLAARLASAAGAVSSSAIGGGGISSAPQPTEPSPAAMTFRFHQQIQHLNKMEDLSHENIAKFCAKLIQQSRDSSTTHQVLDLGLYFHDDVRDILEINMGQKMETDTVLQSLVAKHHGNCQIWTWDSKDVRDVQQALHALYPPSSAGNLKGVPVN
jgi:DNA-directed RNA polymerase subunit F